jgi:hypothetical protein
MERHRRFLAEYLQTIRRVEIQADGGRKHRPSGNNRDDRQR